MSIDEIKPLMLRYQVCNKILEDLDCITPDTPEWIEHKQIEKRFADVGLRIGIDIFGDVGVYPQKEKS